MTAGEQAKKEGTTLKEISDVTGVLLRTLDNWSKHKPLLFKCVIEGTKVLRR